MKKLSGIISVGLLASVAGCGTTNPFVEDAPVDTGTEITLVGIFGENPPPGTAEPVASAGIIRSEPTDGEGAGVASGFVYNSTDDTFFVDNLGFDGENTYTRDASVPTLQNSPNAVMAVYESASSVTDPVSGAPINQFTHKAVYGVSSSGSVRFGIVRTGSYIDYGFGGFVYQRSTFANLPTGGGQARYAGDYAGLRDFSGSGGLQYVTGDMQVNVDFGDTNSNFAVSGSVRNRRLFDQNGTEVTDTYRDQLGTEYDATLTAIPNLIFTLEDTGNLDSAGEMTGALQSQFVANDGSVVVLETGTYYGLIGGPTGNELVGIITTTSDSPGASGVTVRETGGFILVR